MNKKLFHLANDIVKIRQEITKLMNYDQYRGSPFLSLIESLLEIVNEIRMEVAYPKKQEEKRYKIIIPCREDSLTEIVNELQENNWSYIIEDLDSEFEE